MGSKRKRVFIGDVQGCLAELDALLARLDYHSDRHRLWLVGDLVNRGPDSAGVLRRVREIGAKTVLGNHDVNLLALAAGRRQPRRRDNFQSVLREPDAEELLGWLRRRPLIRAWKDLVLVHAGLHPLWTDPKAVARPLELRLRAGKIPLRHPDLRFMTGVRVCDAAGRRPRNGAVDVAGFSPWEEHTAERRMVVCGHWSQRGLVRSKRLRSLDTGCVWGGSLTAWIAEDDEFVQVPAARAYATP